MSLLALSPWLDTGSIVLKTVDQVERLQLALIDQVATHETQAIFVHLNQAARKTKIGNMRQTGLLTAITATHASQHTCQVRHHQYRVWEDAARNRCP